MSHGGHVDCTAQWRECHKGRSSVDSRMFKPRCCPGIRRFVRAATLVRRSNFAYRTLSFLKGG